MKVLVTGSTGFIGSHLCDYLTQQGHQVVGAGSVRGLFTPGFTNGPDGSLPGALPHLLEGCGAVVHLAGRAHVTRSEGLHLSPLYKKANVDLAIDVAQACIEAGVRRMIFASSAGVHGNVTHGRPFHEDSEILPYSPYSLSKAEAERSIEAISKGSGLEVTIIRPAVYYGPGVKGNIRRLLDLLWSGVPLPIAGVDTRRSLISVVNLCSLFEKCLAHPAAAGQAFIASEGTELSPVELARLLSRHLGRTSSFFRMPDSLLQLALALAGRAQDFDRLRGELILDNSKARHVLQWSPVDTSGRSFGAMCDWYKETRSHAA